MSQGLSLLSPGLTLPLTRKGGADFEENSRGCRRDPADCQDPSEGSEERSNGCQGAPARSVAFGPDQGIMPPRL